MKMSEDIQQIGTYWKQLKINPLIIIMWQSDIALQAIYLPSKVILLQPSVLQQRMDPKPLPRYPRLAEKSVLPILGQMAAVAHLLTTWLLRLPVAVASNTNKTMPQLINV